MKNVWDVDMAWFRADKNRIGVSINEFTRKKSALKTISVRFGIVSMVCLACVEAASQYCFNKSVENLKTGTMNIHDSSVGLHDSRTLSAGIPMEELDFYVVGWYWRVDRIDELQSHRHERQTDPNNPPQKWLTARWPSLLGFYKVWMSIDFRDRVFEFGVMSSMDEQ